MTADNTDAALSEGLVTVIESGTGTYTQRITAGRHQLFADEPVPIGDDAGPTPYDLLLAGLGACTSMTVRMYADQHGWPLTGIRVRLSHDKVHAKDCAECESKGTRVDRLQRSVKLVGPLTEEQRAKLTAMADRCPVHRTLESEVEVLTELEE